MSGVSRSLRWRLTTLFVVVAAVAIGGGAAGMSRLLDTAVWAPLDAALEEEAETLAALLPLGDGHQLNLAVNAIGSETDLGPGKFVDIAEGGGSPIARAGNVPASVRATAISGDRPRQTLQVPGHRAPYRVVRVHASTGASVVIGVNVHRQLRTLGNARIAIVASAVGLLLLLAGLAWTITSRATGELGRLAEEIEAIEAGSLGRRVVHRRTLEVDRLAVVLNRLLARLEAAMSELRRFTADAAHELRTPIAALRAHLEVALGRSDSLEDYRDGLLDGLEQTERLGRLAEDLLTLASVEGGGLDVAAAGETVQLDVLAGEVVDFLQPVAQDQGREFKGDLAPDTCVRGVPGLLKRVMLNLLDNAFRHTPPGTPVTLVVRSDGALTRIQVADAGPGIPAAELPTLFERFRRGRTSGPGAGLGLALCREIVARHGGQIAIDSRPGEGTRVEIEIPRVAAPAPAAWTERRRTA